MIKDPLALKEQKRHAIFSAAKRGTGKRKEKKTPATLDPLPWADTYSVVNLAHQSVRRGSGGAVDRPLKCNTQVAERRALFSLLFPLHSPTLERTTEKKIE